MTIESSKSEAKRLADFKLERLEISCPCGRRGSYNVERQIGRYGNIQICDFIAMKVAPVCHLWVRPEKYRKCHAGCEQLLWMFNPAPFTEEYAKAKKW